MHVDIGIDRQQLITMKIELPPETYRRPPVTGAFFDRLAAGVQAVPGVSRAAIKLPPQDRNFFAEYRWVTADYFRTVG